MPTSKHSDSYLNFDLKSLKNDDREKFSSSSLSNSGIDSNEYEGICIVNYNGKNIKINIKAGDGIAIIGNGSPYIFKKNINGHPFYLISTNQQGKLIYSKQHLSSIEIYNAKSQKSYKQTRVGKLKDNQIEIKIYDDRSDAILNKITNSNDTDITKVAFNINFHGVSDSQTNKFLGIKPGNSTVFTKDANNGELVSVSSAVNTMCKIFNKQKQNYINLNKITINLGSCNVVIDDISKLLNEVNKILPPGTEFVIEYANGHLMAGNIKVHGKGNTVNGEPTEKIKYIVGDNKYDVSHKTAPGRQAKYANNYEDQAYKDNNKHQNISFQLTNISNNKNQPNNENQQKTQNAPRKLFNEDSQLKKTSTKEQIQDNENSNHTGNNDDDHKKTIEEMHDFVNATQNGNHPTMYRTNISPSRYLPPKPPFISNISATDNLYRPNIIYSNTSSYIKRSSRNNDVTLSSKRPQVTKRLKDSTLGAYRKFKRKRKKNFIRRNKRQILNNSIGH